MQPKFVVVIRPSHTCSVHIYIASVVQWCGFIYLTYFHIFLYSSCMGISFSIFINIIIIIILYIIYILYFLHIHTHTPNFGLLVSMLRSLQYYKEFLILGFLLVNFFNWRYFRNTTANYTQLFDRISNLNF
jgi:hypothetical protein